jgi:oligopeptide transport system ATP-binding protein
MDDRNVSSPSPVSEHRPPASGTGQALLEVRGLKMYFPITRGFFQRRVGDIKAVDEVSFAIYRGETLGLVGESGCGKTTTGRAILQLYPITDGQVRLDGIDLRRLDNEQMRRMRRRMQMIFQDPYASLNPRATVGGIIETPLRIHGIGTPGERRERVRELLDLVGMNPGFVDRYPHEFSGGQRQRVGIARALAVNPDFIVCDEPIAALDVSIQAQVVNLLQELQARLGLTYLFIAHDLSMVRHLCDRVAVMYLGKIVELTTSIALYASPRHPYTQALISAVPVPNPRLERQRQRIVLAGDLPSPADPPPGCVFNTRCPVAQSLCRQTAPEYREVAPNHWTACHFAR